MDGVDGVYILLHQTKRLHTLSNAGGRCRQSSDLAAENKAYAHTHTHPHTHTYPHTPTHPNRFTQSYLLTPVDGADGAQILLQKTKHTHTHTHTHTLVHTHPHSCTPTHSYILTHSYTIGEVGGWGRDPKKCTGRDWGMGSSAI